MKRGQMAVVLVIVLIVIAVAGFFMFSQKQAEAPAYEAPIYVPVAPVVIAPEPQPVYQPPIGKAYEPPAPAPADLPCVSEYEAKTCHSATNLARKKCYPKDDCTTIEMWPSSGSCFIKLVCT